MNRITRNLSIIYRSERLVQRRRMAVLRRQTGLMVVAGILGGCGLVALNGAGFFMLRTMISPAGAAFALAFGNIVIAALIVVAAEKMSAEDEIKDITEVRDMAIADLEAEATLAAQEARDVANSFRSLARDPFGSVGPSLILPILQAILKMLKSK